MDALQAFETAAKTVRSVGRAAYFYGVAVRGAWTEPFTTAQAARAEAARKALVDDAWDHRPPICGKHYPRPCECVEAHYHTGDQRPCWCDVTTTDPSSIHSPAWQPEVDGEGPAGDCDAPASSPAGLPNILAGDVPAPSPAGTSIIEDLASEIADAVGDHYDHGKQVSPYGFLDLPLWHDDEVHLAFDWTGIAETLLLYFDITPKPLPSSSAAADERVTDRLRDAGFHAAQMFEQHLKAGK